MNIAYTIAYDSEGIGAHRQMAKLLAMSLVRNHFDGDFLIFRNSESPVLQIPRQGIIEHFIETPELPEKMVQAEVWCWKYRVAPIVEEHARRVGAEKVVFLDADMLCLRNPDHLFDGEEDITFCPENRPITDRCWGAFLTTEERKTLRRKGVNSGTMAMRTEKYLDIMREWERIHSGPCAPGQIFLEQGAWNRLILDTKLKTRPFERDAIMFPMNEELDYRVYRDATLVHCLGADARTKVRFMYGLYMSTFFFDDSLTLLNILDM